MHTPLTLGRSFFKGHGHGNDYLVFQEGSDWLVTPAAVRRICHRWRGVGADGIVALLSGPSGVETGTPLPTPPPPGPPFRLRMFNPDGSEFERSGNGLRILGTHLFRRGWVEMGKSFPVEVGGDRVEMTVLGRTADDQLDVAVDMGRTRFGFGAVGGRDEEAGATVVPGPGGEPLDLQPVSVGNPHCVVFRDRLEETDLSALGPFLTSHPVFPEGANIQLARVVGEGRVEILIWERGVGRTSSSGTSACAVASACVHRGRLSPGRIRVEMEGGIFWVTVSEEMEVRLEGPVASVMDGDLTREILSTFGP